MLKRARCSACSYRLPLAPAIHRFLPPPYMMRCPKCGVSIKTSLAYRATWLEFLLWKVCVILAFGLGFVVSLAEGRSLQFSFVAGLFMAFLAGLLGGFIVSTILAFPLQLLIDLATLPFRRRAASPDST